MQRLLRKLVVSAVVFWCLLQSVGSSSGSVAVAGPSTLVLVDDLNLRNTHSAFFNGLTGRGHVLTFSHVYDDEETELIRYGEWQYDNLIIFAPTADALGEHISVETVIEFIDSGRNVLIAANENVSEPIREIANECGVDFDEEQTMVVDHFNYDSSDANGPHTLLVLDELLKSEVIVGAGAKNPILFRGIGHAVQEGSRLVSKVLTGTETSYSHEPRGRVTEYPQSAGRDTLLVTAIQARNNARIVFSGSLEMFSNKLFNSAVERTGGGKRFDRSGNDDFCRELAIWTFHERGLLRATALTHSQQGSKELNPAAYRVKDNIDFSVVIEQFSGNQWVPFTGKDVQLEFVMIDPYVRLNLQNDGKGKYFASFQVPDVYGVFKFRVSYHRTGWSNLELAQQVSVHPFRHDQFERFIAVAGPYYASTGCNMVAFFIFAIVFLFNKYA